MAPITSQGHQGRQVLRIFYSYHHTTSIFVEIVHHGYEGNAYSELGLIIGFAAVIITGLLGLKVWNKRRKFAAARDSSPTKQLRKNGLAEMPEDDQLLVPDKKLEPEDDHNIANLFSAARETGELFPRVMESLLENNSDAAVKNKINELLQMHDYYYAVMKTMQRYRQFRAGRATFNALAMQAGKAGMKDVAGRILKRKSTQQEADIIFQLTATPAAAAGSQL